MRECQTIFAQYDKNRSGMLEFDELRSALGDLGLLVSLHCTDRTNLTSSIVGVLLKGLVVSCLKLHCHAVDCLGCLGANSHGVCP